MSVATVIDRGQRNQGKPLCQGQPRITRATVDSLAIVGPIEGLVAELCRRAMKAADELRAKTKPNEKLNAGAALAELLASEGFVYDYKAIQAWGRDKDSNPPSRAFLAAMRVTGVSVDEVLRDKTIWDELRDLRAELEGLRNDLER